MTNKEFNEKINTIAGAIIGKKVEKELKVESDYNEMYPNADAMNCVMNSFSEQTGSGCPIEMDFVRMDITGEYKALHQKKESIGTITIPEDVINSYEWVIFLYGDMLINLENLDFKGLRYEQVVEKLKQIKVIE